MFSIVEKRQSAVANPCSQLPGRQPSYQLHLHLYVHHAFCFFRSHEGEVRGWPPLVHHDRTPPADKLTRWKLFPSTFINPPPVDHQNPNSKLFHTFSHIGTCSPKPTFINPSPLPSVVDHQNLNSKISHMFAHWRLFPPSTPSSTLGCLILPTSHPSAQEPSTSTPQQHSLLFTRTSTCLWGACGRPLCR